MLLLPAVSGWASPTKRIEVYAHRGVRAFAPENTLPAYEAALRIGADWMDMDVVLTGEGEVLLSHDLVLNPDITRDARGRFLAQSQEALAKYSSAARREYDRKYAVKGLTLQQLAEFDVGRVNPDSAYARLFPDQVPVDGTRMPTLREVVRFVDRASGKKARFQIEMKTDPSRPDYSPPPADFAAAVYEVLREEGILDRVEVHAFDFRCLDELRKLDRDVRTAYLTSRDNEEGGADSFYGSDPNVAGLWTGGKLLKDHGNSIPAMVKALGGVAWDPEDAELTRQALDEAHRLGLRVVVWSWPEKLGTAFDADLVAKMIDWGVDGIITDDPGRLISMLAARGLPVPDRCSARGETGIASWREFSPWRTSRVRLGARCLRERGTGPRSAPADFESLVQSPMPNRRFPSCESRAARRSLRPPALAAGARTLGAPEQR